MSSVRSAGGPVLCSGSWLCHGDLSSVLHVADPAQPATTTPGITAREECVVLELPCPTGDATPCTLTISCAAQGTHHILEVSLCSEARTIEVYSISEDGQEEEYLGTSRGEKCSFRSCGDDAPITLYRAYLKLDFPVPACKVKLLSLGEKQSVLVGEIAVRVTSVPERCSQTPSLLGTSINLERVQSMMDSMGGKMSPGAEQLMNMVRAQQKNQTPFGSHLLQLFGSFHPQAYQNKKDPKEETLQLAQTIPDTRLEAAHSSVQQPPPTDVRADKLDPALEKVLSAHMERLERNLMKHIDQRMRCLQEHLDTRIDRLFVCLLERGDKSNPHPGTTGDKFVNGHMDYTHEDSDCNILPVQ